ncbi:hypothetical protein EUGRSUZ_J02481 [Eucalyptus grandis]|uniref:Uncharacterized protein n=2 Tax=Eucalyptus grandis TaxID=71139 RepID=A0ACC3J913_EUCGR|nr:hypothetical protein EUGRSUZ_J02481 [Eucalyptus grandis]
MKKKLCQSRTQGAEHNVKTYASLNPRRRHMFFRTQLHGKRKTRSPSLRLAPPLHDTLHLLLLHPSRTGRSGRSSGRRRTTCRHRPCGTRACRGAPARPRLRPPSIPTGTRSKPRLRTAPRSSLTRREMPMRPP